MAHGVCSGYCVGLGKQSCSTPGPVTTWVGACSQTAIVFPQFIVG